MLALSAVAALGIGYVTRAVPPTRALVLPRASASTAAASRQGGPTHDEFTYRADRYGQFYLDAEIDGTTIRFLVDTGAAYLSLTPKDAATIGLSPASLNYNLHMITAKGPARAAEVRVREVRIGQLIVEDVPAIVMEDHSRNSLLGMSFLSRLDGYHISNGVLTMEW
ncbi:MAG TPA: TIGR02281 family clan AA aspartic protease [Stellaceae bacterium]|nr:TIGR02281 family clan AA aspartic protease [Stellaceae bacterium]